VLVPVPAGVLDCYVSVADKSPDAEEECRLRVLLPTGVELQSQRLPVPGTCRFERLPTGVPLVVAVEAAGYLRGLCCDVRLAKDGPASKSIVLAPAPLVSVAVQFGPAGSSRRAPPGLRVELFAGEESVAEGTTDADGEALLLPAAFGVLRARVSLNDATLAEGPTVLVDPFVAEQHAVVAIPDGADVEVRVLTPDGDPAGGVRVWLLGELSRRAPQTADRDGVAVFHLIQPGLRLTALARGGDGTFGSAAVQTGATPPSRIPLLLGAPQTLAGDVVDQGNSVLRGATVEVVVRPLAEPVVVASDDAGLFETPPLPGGLADVVVRCDGYLDWRSPQAVEIRPGVGARIRARMTPRPKGTVFVRVYDESGSPVEGAEVSAEPSRARAITDASGACRFDGLDAGSEQTFAARRRGYRGRAGPLSSARVPRDAGAGAEVVVRIAAAEPPEAGPVTSTGVILGPDGDPVAAARVTAGASVAYTDAAGRFRLTGLSASAADPVDLRVVPSASLLEPLRVLVLPDGKGHADLGEVRLRSRPYALLEIPHPARSLTGVRGVAWPQGESRAFWLSSSHADTLLGAAWGVFEPIACVSYDGTWIHLPPADDWIADGRGEVFVGFATPRGLFTTTCAWTLAPDATPRLVLPALPVAVRLDLSEVRNTALRARKTEGRITFAQVECATLFDPRSIHVPTGNAQAPVDPFASLAAWRVFGVATSELERWTWRVAPGKWRLSGPDGLKETIDVPADAGSAAGRKPGK
jgi:hypothetical protein